jgi:hypothetical protein
MDAIFIMGKHPWEGRFLYNGFIYAASETPWHYVPVSIGIQLTLPALVFSALGMTFALAARKEKSQRVGKASLFLIWMALPLATVLLIHANIYSAFRQLMFVVPPMFILGSIGFDRIIGLFRNRVWALPIILLALAPGLLGIIRLHPYELIYHNELVGGVPGAVGRYALDSWGTEYREVVEYLNGEAFIGSTILVRTREFHVMTPFAREDLKFGTLTLDAIESAKTETYLVDGGAIGDRFNAVTKYVVEREGVPLAVVQYLP